MINSPFSVRRRESRRRRWTRCTDEFGSFLRRWQCWQDCNSSAGRSTRRRCRELEPRFDATKSRRSPLLSLSTSHNLACTHASRAQTTQSTNSYTHHTLPLTPPTRMTQNGQTGLEGSMSASLPPLLLTGTAGVLACWNANADGDSHSHHLTRTHPRSPSPSHPPLPLARQRQSRSKTRHCPQTPLGRRR